MYKFLLWILGVLTIRWMSIDARGIKMKIYPITPCMYCGRVQIDGVWQECHIKWEEINPEKDGYVSHGLCPRCYTIQMGDLFLQRKRRRKK